MKYWSGTFTIGLLIQGLYFKCYDKNNPKYNILNRHNCDAPNFIKCAKNRRI